MVKGYVFKLSKGIVQIKATRPDIARAVVAACYPGQDYELISINYNPL